MRLTLAFMQSTAGNISKPLLDRTSIFYSKILEINGTLFPDRQRFLCSSPEISFRLGLFCSFVLPIKVNKKVSYIFHEWSGAIVTEGGKQY